MEINGQTYSARVTLWLYHFIIHKNKPCPMSPVPAVTYVTLMWFLRSDHKDWILCDHIPVRPHLAWKWRLYISQVVVILEYVWTILTHTPPVLFISLHHSECALRWGCNQTISRKQVWSLPQAFGENLEEQCEHSQIYGNAGGHLIHPGIIGW